MPNREPIETTNLDTIYGSDTLPWSRPRDLLEALDRARAEAGPHRVGEQAEEAVEVGLVGPDQPVRQQVEAQVAVVGIEGRVVEGVEERGHRDALDVASLVASQGAGDVPAQQLGGPLG